MNTSSLNLIVGGIGLIIMLVGLLLLNYPTCEQDILDQMKLIEESNEIIFEFNAEVLPYQGFEVMWDFSA